ncbi:unnamed protein product [Thelazia callipaeda]|uniref:Uncharacterized protein n=1 Tax=Thelazia callipaeda TaxID=103827 RepID=A0A0N5DBZ1_THECL|nr:unnamed protein product [Thelazia callipaeda]
MSMKRSAVISRHHLQLSSKSNLVLNVPSHLTQRSSPVNNYISARLRQSRWSAEVLREVLNCYEKVAMGNRSCDVPRMITSSQAPVESTTSLKNAPLCIHIRQNIEADLPRWRGKGLRCEIAATVFAREQALNEIHCNSSG